MTQPSRRQLLGLGLSAGLTAWLAHAGDAEPETAADADLAGALRFRIAPDYRPDVSVAAQQRMTRATLDFLLDSHPPGLTLSIWETEPRKMPFLEEHLASVVAAVCEGVASHLPAQPVDPLLMLALLYNESRFAPTALSPAGALGMAQFMPDTALEYALEPIAQAELWQRYRTARGEARAQRARQRNAFVKQFGLRQFSADAAIAGALRSDSLEVLAAYQAIVDAPRPETEVLDEYLAAVRAELAAHDFFGAGEQSLARIDGRVSYAAATAAVDYVAQRLSENSGMASSSVAAYNAGPSAVRAGNPTSVLYGYGELPAIPETVRYVQRIIVVYSKLQAGLAG